MELRADSKVREVFDTYPKEVRSKLLHLRELVIETAKSLQDVDILDETLKWGEPSYKTKIGSTLRMAWKEGTPHQYAMYFTCSTGLVGAFKMAHGNIFDYEGNRAIVFHKDDAVPENELVQCITLALTYHKIKHLPMLGV